MAGTSESNLWLFGYGSIVWKTEFPLEKSVFGYVNGFYRRFWQGSPDHRGVPGALGRVVTLIHAEAMGQFEDPHYDNSSESDVVWGRAYSIPASEVPEVLAQLDHREKAGYERCEVKVHCNDGETRTALVFIALPDNEDFLGPAPLKEMAAQIASRVGPSGPNSEYLLNLCESMKAINVQDPHLLALEKEVLRIRNSDIIE